jgi:hypothetical protein
VRDKDCVHGPKPSGLTVFLVDATSRLAIIQDDIIILRVLPAHVLLHRSQHKGQGGYSRRAAPVRLRPREHVAADAAEQPHHEGRDEACMEWPDDALVPSFGLHICAVAAVVSTARRLCLLD